MNEQEREMSAICNKLADIKESIDSLTIGMYLLTFASLLLILALLASP